MSDCALRWRFGRRRQTLNANSSLQCLFATPGFRNSLLLLEDQREHLGNAALQKTFALMLMLNSDIVDAKEVLDHLRPAYFVLGDQEDAAEFLVHVLYTFEWKGVTNLVYECCDRVSEIQDREMTIVLPFLGDLKRRFTVKGLLGYLLAPEMQENETSGSCKQPADRMRTRILMTVPQHLILKLNTC